MAAGTEVGSDDAPAGDDGAESDTTITYTLPSDTAHVHADGFGADGTRGSTAVEPEVTHATDEVGSSLFVSMAGSSLFMLMTRLSAPLGNKACFERDR